MRRNRKSTTLLLLGILALGLTLGYAYLNTTLNIDGTVNVSSANWDVYWDNIQYSSNNVTDVTTPATISTGKTEVAFNVNFKEPGDTYEFTVDAVNDGSIDAMIDTVTTGVYATNGVTEKQMPEYLDFIVTYIDEVEIEPNQILAAGTREKYKVKVYYKDEIDANQLPSTSDNYLFKFRVTYVQKGPSGIPKPLSPYVYTNDYWSRYIGESFPEGSPDGYNNYQDVLAAHDYRTFIKYKYVNDIIVESYIGIFYNNKVYYLKGEICDYDYQEDHWVSLYYEDNKNVLSKAFGSNNCSVIYYQGVEGAYRCSTADNMYAQITTEGNNSVGDLSHYSHPWYCKTYSEGGSYCNEFE